MENFLETENDKQIAAIARGNGKSLITLIHDLARYTILAFNYMKRECPHRKAVHHMTHGSQRVRKKNTKRVLKWYKEDLRRRQNETHT